MGWLWFHRVYMIGVLPFVWLLAVAMYVVFAPIEATQAVSEKFKQHWKAQ